MSRSSLRLFHRRESISESDFKVSIASLKVMRACSCLVIDADFVVVVVAADDDAVVAVRYSFKKKGVHELCSVQYRFDSAQKNSNNAVSQVYYSRRD